MNVDVRVALNKSRAMTQFCGIQVCRRAVALDQITYQAQL